MPGDSISPNYSKTARCLFYSINVVLVSDARPAALPTAWATHAFPLPTHPAFPVPTAWATHALPVPTHPALWRDPAEEGGGTPKAMASGGRLLPKMLISPRCLPPWTTNTCFPFPLPTSLPAENQPLRKSFIQSTSHKHLRNDCTSHL